MTSLIARLEAAEKGSRELSDECLLAVGWTKTREKLSFGGTHTVWRNPAGEVFYPSNSLKGGQFLPDPSQDLRDAVDWMVPDGWGIQVKRTPDGRGFAKLFDSTPYPNVRKTDAVEAANPALAASAASLRAMEEKS